MDAGVLIGILGWTASFGSLGRMAGLQHAALLRPDCSTWTDGTQVTTVPNPWMSDFFRATVEATEEAIVNALIAAGDVDGVHGRLFGIPHDELRDVLERFGRSKRWRVNALSMRAFVAVETIRVDPGGAA